MKRYKFIYTLNQIGHIASCSITDTDKFHHEGLLFLWYGTDQSFRPTKDSKSVEYDSIEEIYESLVKFDSQETSLLAQFTKEFL